MPGTSPGMTKKEPSSNIEKHRLVVALQADVEAVDGAAIARLARRDQGGAAIERTLAERTLRTRDLGGNADTTTCGKAVAEMVE